MKLTREQAAAALLVLAGGGGGGGAGGAGGSAGGSAGGTAGSGHAVGGSGAGSSYKPTVPGGGGKKVSTTQGAAYYHLPIGALIVAHGKATKTTGAAQAKPGEPPEPETMPKGWIPEPKWLEGQAEWEAIWKANEWKGHGSKHIWASGHMFSVPGDADVYVPGTINVGSDHDVAEAKKFVIIGTPGAGRAAALLPNGEFQEVDLTAALVDGLKEHGTKLPSNNGVPHLPVQPDGPSGTTHWVPEGWHVYVYPSVTNYLYAESPDGEWHTISKSGIKDWKKEGQGGQVSKFSQFMDAKLESGQLLPYEHPAIHAEHQPPPSGKLGAEPIAGNTTIAGQDGPIDVSYQQISDAIKLLEADQSTQVKLPLKHADHPLQAMDYHAISKQEIGAYPELKLAPGSKQKHVGQVKIAVLHYLGRVLDEQPKNDVQQAQADAIPGKIAEQVNASYELAPTVTVLGAQEEGQPVSLPQPDLQDLAKKVKALPAEPPAATPEPEYPKVSPNALGDGPKVVGGVAATAKDMQEAIDLLEAHPNSTAIKQILKGNGNKLWQADYWAVIHAYEAETGVKAKGKARELFISALKGYLAKASEADESSYTNSAAELKNLVEKAVEKYGPQNYPYPGEGTFGQQLANALMSAYGWGEIRYVHKVTDGIWAMAVEKPPSEVTTYTVHDSLHVSFDTAEGTTGVWTAKDVLAMASKYLGPKLSEEYGTGLKSLAQKIAEKPKEPGPWKAGDKVTDDKGITGEVVNVTEASSAVKQYVSYKDDAGVYHTAYAENLTEAEVAADDAQGQLEKAQRDAETPEQTGPEKPRPKPSPTPGIPVTGETYGKPWSHEAPEGSKVYSEKTYTGGTKWAKYPDGSWHTFTADIAGTETPSYNQLDEYVDSGKIVELDGQGNPIVPKEESLETQIHNLAMKLTSTEAVWGTGKPLSAKLAAALIMSANEDNHYFTAQELNDHLLNASAYGWGEKLANALMSAVYIVPSIEGGWQNLVGAEPGDETQFWYQVYPNGKVWKGGFQAEETSVDTDDVVKLLKGESPMETKTPEPVKLVDITSYGKPIGKIPEEAVVYSGKHASLANVLADKVTKYIKYPDGSWYAAHVYGDAPAELEAQGTSDTLDEQAALGDLVPISDLLAKAKKLEATGPAKDTPAAEGGPPASMKVIVGGKIIPGDVPAGSQLYKGNYDEIYIKYPPGGPDAGAWYKASTYGVSKAGTYYTEKYDAYVEKGIFKKIQPFTEAELAKAQEVTDYKKKFADGSWNYPIAGGTDTWQQRMVVWLASKPGEDGFFYQTPAGKWQRSKYGTPGGAYVHISSTTLTGEQVSADGQVTPISYDEVKAAIDQHLVEDAIMVNGSVHKYGNWYNPKGKGTYLEIKSGNGAGGGYNKIYKYGKAAKATYIWHKQDGTSSAVSPTYAEKVLENATEYHPPGETKTYEPKGKKAAVTSYITALGEAGGTYHLETSTNAPQQTIDLHPDGSALLHYGEFHSEQPLDTYASLLKTGGIQDIYGNTVIQPGLKPKYYFVFGNKFTEGEVNDLIKEIEKAYNDQKLLNSIFNAWLPSKPQAQAWAAAKNVGANWEAQRDALLGLLREMVGVASGQMNPAAPQGEPKFLKSLPPGISTAQDIFEFNAEGHAKPTESALPSYDQPLSAYTGPDLTDYVKGVSEWFGGGKVVGTHPASMPKNAKIAWLTAWREGDMVKIFNLDAEAGKVSPAHPGAPDNTLTHHITWAPWGKNEKPAGQIPEGEWSEYEKVTLPKAEVANYIIKAGLQHAEYLTDTQRRNWVTFHRQGTQEAVDKLSKIADQRYQAGYPVQSEIPKWTDNIKPAKSYDIFLEEGTPAANWGVQASKDFYSEFYDEKLAPFDENNYGKGVDSIYAREEVIGRYLEDLKQKEIAEKSKPVYTLTQGGASPVSSHPIFEITETIPLTDKTTPYFFKPAPPGEAFLAEQEHGASELAHAWGFKTPPSKLLTFEGKYGQAQQKLDNVGDLEYGAHLGFYDTAPIPWSELTPAQISDIAREHILDWSLGNDDGRASNFLRLADGSIVGIDKGRFAAPGWQNWDGLSGNGSADARSAQVVTALYDAIRSGEISKDVADEAYKAVIQRARRMEKLSDERMTEILKAAFEHRPGNTDKLISELVARKGTLEHDFQDLWQRVYSQAKLGELPEVPEAKLPDLADGTALHSGFSESSFMEHVHTTGVHGQPAFFASSELEHGHFLVWKEYDAGGSPVIKGQSSARGETLESLVAWAKSHEGKGPVNTPQVKGKAFVKDADTWYGQIIAAAKTISFHQDDQQFNQAKLDGLNAAKMAMEHRLEAAEEILNSGDEKQMAAFTENYAWGTPAANVAAIKYYLPLVAKVEQAKEDHYKFQSGELPKWAPPADLPEPSKAAAAAPPAPEVKAVLKTPSRPGSEEGLSSDGELHTDGYPFQYSGELAWHVDLPTGEQVVIWNSDGYVQRAHYGRLEFKAVAEDGAASLERIRSFLQGIGMNLDEAEEHDLELHYWRHLAHVMADRKDRDSGPRAKVWKSLKAAATAQGMEWDSSVYSLGDNVEMLAKSSLSPDAELAMYRAAFANLTNEAQVAKFVDAKGWLPRLRHWDLHNPTVGSGNPYYLRFDANLQDIDASMSTLPSTKFTSLDAKGVLSGGLHSRDDRIRMLGNDNADGMGNEFSYGSTNYIYTRLNQSGGKHSERNVFLSPSILAHTTTYGFQDDEWGNTSKRSSYAYFDLEKAAQWGDSSNETMVKEGISLLDEVELLVAPTSSERETIINELQELGIYEIRGVPVTERILDPTMNYSDALKTIKAAMKAENYGWTW